jgi:hypothetical protein
VQVPAITTAQMWMAAGVTAVVDIALVVLLTRWLRPPWRRRLPLALLGVGTVCFSALFSGVLWHYWDSCYALALPRYMKTFAPLVGAALGAMGWLFWWIARRLTGWAVPLFLALGGLESLPGHLNGIYRFGLLDRCPLVQGVSPSSALVFGIFEFGFYWSVFLALSALVARLGPDQDLHRKQEPPGSR